MSGFHLRFLRISKYSMDFNLIYLDTSVLQYMAKHGDEINDGLDPFENERLKKINQGCEQVDALRKIVFIGRRSVLPFIFSDAVMQEIFDADDAYIIEMLTWCWEENRRYVDIQKGSQAIKIDAPSFGYLSGEDKKVVKDAICLGCDGLLTMDRRLQKNYLALQRSLNLKVMTPLNYWDELRPHAELF